MNTRQSIDMHATGFMVIIGIIWGLQQVAIKYIAANIAPIFQVGIRSGVGALLLALFISIRKQWPTFHKGVGYYGLIAAILFACEYLFVGEGLKYTTASHMIVFLYTAPIFAAIGLHYFLPEEKLAPFQWFGIAVAFVGIILAFHLSSADHTKQGYISLIGDGLGLMGGISWGMTTVVIRCTPLSNCPASQTVWYQLIGSFIILTLCSILFQETYIQWNTAVLISLGFQSIILCFISFLIWTWLLRIYLATQLGILCLMTPFFGVSFGALILHEPLLPQFITGSIFVLIGVLTVISYPWLRMQLKYLGRTRTKQKKLRARALRRSVNKQA